MKPSDPSSVLAIVHETEYHKYGTGFVVHTELGPKADMCTAFLITCAHVVTRIGENKMTVGGEPAELVTKADRDNPDLAVIRVVLPADGVNRLPVDREIFPGLSGKVHGYCRTETSHDLTPLNVQVTKFITPSLFGCMPGPPKLQVTLALDEQVEPDQIEEGYSGSPLLVDGRVRAVVDTRRTIVGHQRYKVGTAVPIRRLEEIWPQMPEALRCQLGGSADTLEPLRSLLSLNSQVPPNIAREVFDIAACKLLPWPSRGRSQDFTQCVRLLADLERVELADASYHPLAEYVWRVADRLEDSNSAEQLRRIIADGGFKPSILPDNEEPDPAAEHQQALVIRIIPDVNAIAEAIGSARCLRLLPYLWEQELRPCRESCEAGACQSVPAPARSRLTFLGCLALETSTAQLGQDLQGKMSDLFSKFVGGVPNRVEFFVPRAHVAAALKAGVDHLPVRLDPADEFADEDSLNAWATTCYHIDERLQEAEERKQLAARLAPWSGPIKLVKRAKSVEQLTNNPRTAYDHVVVGEERAAAIVDCLRNRSSVICAMFLDPDSARRNLANAVRAPVPFVLLSRLPEAIGTLNKLVKHTHCLRQFPRALKDKIVSDDPLAPHASQIAAIVDLPEYRCDFENAVQEPIENENL